MAKPVQKYVSMILMMKSLRSCKERFNKEGLDVFTLKFNVTDEADVDKGISAN